MSNVFTGNTFKAIQGGFVYVVENYDELVENHPASENNGRRAWVKHSQLMPPKNSGIYLSDGTEWIRIQTSVTIEDVLTSMSITNALSANQGRILKNIIDRISDFVADNEERIGNIVYLGKGIDLSPLNWVIYRYDVSGDTIGRTKADETTNSTYETYSDAWTDKATLTYT